MEILELLNPWWKVGMVSKALAMPYRRKIFAEIKKLLGVRQVTVISGLRRVGKSTLMYQLIEDLVRSGTKPENILYFSFDERAENLLDVLAKYSELAKADWKGGKCFIFFDEIQKLHDWSNKLKTIYDAFPNLKIIISGSSSFHLEKEAKINLAGRHFVANVEPLGFAEYLEMKKSRIDLNKMELWESEIRKEFMEYLYRPFPELVNYEDLGLVKSYIKDNVVEKVLQADLSKRFRHINPDLLTRLVDIFYGQPGSYLNYDDISKELKVSKNTLLRHVYYLEFAYVVRRIRNFRPGARTTSRKLQRAYPFHFALRFGWNGRIDYETAVASILDLRYYWRKWDKEIDFLDIKTGMLPIEVKEGESVGKSDLKTLLYFMSRFGVKEALVVYNGEEGEIKENGLTIKKIPLWKLFISRR